jgi:hypothetical protein
VYRSNNWKLENSSTHTFLKVVVISKINFNKTNVEAAIILVNIIAASTLLSMIFITIFLNL